MTEDEYLNSIQKNMKEMHASTYEDYGSEDQNTLMNLIKQYKGDYDTMDEKFVKKVSSLIDEIKNYEQVISDATGAMTSAEYELAEVLDEEEKTSST